MTRPGTAELPLRVAVVGSGPAGFYTVQQLLQSGIAVRIDMFDRLPTPFGLVRHGVAPDHPKIKTVIEVYHKLALDPAFRFYGNVEYGTDLTRVDLERYYHQIVFATGAQTDRQLGIPGESLAGSHPATEFVAWYNGHPDFSHLAFDLDAERVAVVGVGNVAIDVARILCRTPDELAATDIADYALEALRRSRVREVHLLGRRGPAQAAFTNPELKELGALQDATVQTRGAEVELDPETLAEVASDRTTLRKVELLQGYASPPAGDRSRRLEIRFYVSPIEITGGGGRVRGLRLARNELVRDSSGALSPRPTGETEDLRADLVFRSVGYRGVPLRDLPFDERKGIVPSERGRVWAPGHEGPESGLYVTGWIKRGPSGVIGTNKPDAAETVRSMLEDLSAGAILTPSAPEPSAIDETLRARGVRFVSYDDWRHIDAIEIARGELAGRPRVKLTDREAFLAALALR